jgi:hypothetical protein
MSESNVVKSESNVVAKSVSFHTVRKAPMAARASRISAIWGAFDDAGVGNVTSKHLPQFAEQSGLNLTTVKCQFYAWRATRSQQN